MRPPSSKAMLRTVLDLILVVGCGTSDGTPGGAPSPNASSGSAGFTVVPAQRMQLGGFTDFRFNFYAWHPASYAFDLYYDEIVLDTNPVACLAQ
jgi:hypothetical protein